MASGAPANNEYEPGSLFSAPEETDDTHKGNNYFYSSLGEVIKLIKPSLENTKIGKCGQNAKFDTYILKRFGIDVHPIVFDSMVASFIINPDRKHNLDALSREYLKYNQ